MPLDAGGASLPRYVSLESGTISARRPVAAPHERSPGSPNSTGILAQEKFRGESMLFLRKEAELRKCPEPLFKGDAPELQPDPPAVSCSGRLDYQEGMGVRLLPEGLQSGERLEESYHVALGRGCLPPTPKIGGAGRLIPRRPFPNSPHQFRHLVARRPRLEAL